MKKELPTLTIIKTSNLQISKNAGINAVLVRAKNTNNYQYYCKDLKGVFNVLETVAQPWTVY